MPRLNMKLQMERLGFTDASMLLQPGVYILGFKDEIVWVGQSMAVAKRIGSHLSHQSFAFDSVYFLPVDPADLAAVENRLILELNPRYNVVTPDVYHKAKLELSGNYDQANMRRINAIMNRRHLGSGWFGHVDEWLDGTESERY